MKPEKREAARRLRQEQGLSINEICKRLGVAKGSVSVWVRDIQLTAEQKAELERQHYAYRAQVEGGATNARKFRELRSEYQQDGRLKARERDPLHIAGCMLYWAEGRKNKNSLALINSDVDMLRFFAQFLRESLLVNNAQISLYINCYLNIGISVTEIERFWIDALNLAPSNLRKTIINNQPRSSQQKGRKLAYGVCTIFVSSTRLVQHIFGAIQEYTGIDKPEWLM
jgi:transposase-like protein